MKCVKNDESTIISAIPTTYNGITFRSQIESKFACCCDKLNIKWQYEPKHFILKKSATKYTPDFYLPELKLWVEIKGIIMDEHINILKELSEELNEESMIVSSTNSYYIEKWKDKDEIKYDTWLDNAVIFGLCSKCNSIFFCGQCGDYRCRNCEYHNGNDDIKDCGENLIEEIFKFIKLTSQN